MIAFDLDGVVINTYAVLQTCFLRDYGYDIRTNCSRFQIEIPGVPTKRMHEAVYRYLQKECLEAEPLNHAPLYIRWFLEKMKWPAIFITARMRELSEEATRKWLDKHLDIPYEIIFTGSSSKKADILKDRGIDFFIDDRFRTMDQIGPVLKIAFLYNQPWNQGREPLSSNVIRVNDLGEVVNYFRRNGMVSEEIGRRVA